jgi:hypothetical protein
MGLARDKTKMTHSIYISTFIRVGLTSSTKASTSDHILQAVSYDTIYTSTSHAGITDRASTAIGRFTALCRRADGGVHAYIP